MMRLSAAPPMSWFHHPAVQSLALPAVAAACAMALAGRRPARWAALAPGLALLVALALLPGWHWPAAAAAQKLPWIVLGGLLLAALPSPLAWAVAVPGWAGASAWLAGDRLAALPLFAAGAIGAAVLTLLVRAEAADAAGDPGPPGTGGAATGAALAVASLGLAALAAGGGSLLLAQLALALATVGGVAALWRWVRPVPLPRTTWLPLGLAWLAIAQALAALGGVLPLLLLTPAFAAALLTRSRWLARRPRRAPPWVALAATLPAALAVAAALLWGAPPAATSAPDTDDPYFEPRWQ
jgi:hypothetical protein